jgi:hypothetical protein
LNLTLPTREIAPAPTGKTPCILGIDPGLTGALAFFFPDHPERVAVEDMPVVAGGIDAANLFERIVQLRPDAVFVERNFFMPDAARAAIATTMEGYGVIKGVIACLGIPLYIVSTAVWKKHHRLLQGKGTERADRHEASRALALHLFPATASHFARKKDHGRAEAALIARYGADVLGSSQSIPSFIPAKGRET